MTVLLFIVALVVIIVLLVRLSSANDRIRRLEERIWRLEKEIEHRAKAQFDAWRQNEYDTLKQQLAEVATREAQAQLQQWKVSSEAAIRQEAIQKSQSVIVGKVTEHVAPFLPDFRYNPKDARFIGSPVDLVVFDGLDAGTVEQVVFIEVKSGSGSLSKRERHIRDAILAGKVKWEEMRIAVREQGSGTPIGGEKHMARSPTRM